MAAATTLALTLPLAGVASADPKPDPVPTQKQVDRARADVASKRQSVAAARGRSSRPPTRACSRLHSTPASPPRPTTAPCGASPRPRSPCARPRPQEQQAKEDVKVQRSGIVTFVTESYQNGTELNSATAMMSDEGPKGLMNRYGVVESAGDSMEAALRRLPRGVRRRQGLHREGGQGPEAPGVARRRGTRAAQRRRGGRQLRRRRRRPDRHAEGRAGPGAREGPEHLRRAGRRAAAGARADRAGEGRRGRAGQGARGGQGGSSFARSRQGVGAEREVRQAGPAGTPRTTATSNRQLDRWRLRRPGPAGQRLTARTRHRRPARGRLRQGDSWASPTSGPPPVRTRSTAPA